LGLEQGNEATKLSADEAKRKIALFLKTGRLRPTRHCLRDSMPSRNVTTQDVLHVLETGEIIRNPQWDKDHGEWKYIVEGVDLDGEDLRAVTVFFDANLTLIIVTVF
jgi:hypothetical protein